MLAQESWYQSAARNERSRLFPKGIVGLFALSMLLVGWLALPSKSLHDRLANAQDSDVLTVAYLRAWLNAAPDDLRIRLTLARHLALTGNDNKSIALINELIPQASGSVLQSARRLKLNILERRLYAMHELDSRRKQLLAQIRSELELVASELTGSVELEAMLERANAVEHHTLIASLLKRLGGVNPADQGNILNGLENDLPQASAQSSEAYARQAIALGDFRLAAAIYWRAFDDAQAHQERRRFLMLAATAEQAGNRLPEFFKALDSRLMLVTLDSNNYQQLARMALSVGRHDLAKYFAKRMLQFSGWWKNVQFGDAGRLMQVGWRWMVGHAHLISPIGSAQAQEVTEEEQFISPGPSHTGVRLAKPAIAPPKPVVQEAVISPGKPTVPSAEPPPAVSHREVPTSKHTTKEVREFDSASDEPDQMSVDRPKIMTVRVGNEPAAPKAQSTVPTNPVRTTEVLQGPVAQSDPLAQVISQSLAGQAIRNVPKEEREQVTNAVLPAHLRGRVPGRQQFGPDGSILLGDPANPDVELVPEPWITVKRLDPGLFARSNDKATESAQSQYAQQEDAALSELDGNLGELYGKLQDSVPKRKRRFSEKLPTEMPHLAFNQDKYLLAFQVFLAGSSLDNAYAVALAAVDQRPGSMQWRVRLAQTAQWSQRPIAALNQWMYLAKRTKKAVYWKNVERLAVGLLDQDALLEYLQWEIARSPNNVTTILRIAQVHENTGDPDRAIQWLQRQIARGEPIATEAVYDELVLLHEQTGRNDDAIDVLVAMSNKFGPNIKRSLRLSSALYRRGDVQLAFDALEFSAALAADVETHTAAQEREVPFWENYVQLARLIQRDNAALRGYRQLLAREVFSAKTILAMSSMLESRSLTAAAETMSLGYFRFRQPELAEKTVALWLRAGQLTAVNQFLAQMPRAERDAITRSVTFLRQRANYYQAAGLFGSAVADLIQVHQLEPDNMDTRSALLWALLAKRDSRRLRALLNSWRPEAEKNPKLWGPFAASLLALGEPNQALPYFVRQARERDDYLWWLSYADALDAVGHADSAWTLRRRAWVELRKNAKQELKESPEKRQRIVSLAMRFAPARQAHALLAQLVRDNYEQSATKAPQSAEPVMTAELAASASAGTVLASLLQSLPDDPGADANTDVPTVVTPAESDAMRSAASELAVSYFLSQRNVDSARAWLLSRYAEDLVQPAWANLSIALANHDNEELDRLLTTMPDWLPKLDRIAALRRVGRISEAQTLAFDTMNERPNSDTAHEALVESLMQGGPSAGITAVSVRQEALNYTRNRIDGALRIDQHAQVYGFAESGQTSSIDNTRLNDANSKQRHTGMGFKWTRPDGLITGEISQRSGLADNVALRARWQHMVNPMLDLAVDGGINQPTSELPALTVGGQKDHIRGLATVNLTGRDYINGSVKLGQLETQLGTRMARLNQFQLEYGHKWRLDYPDVTFRAQLVRSNYSKSNKTDPITTQLVPFGVPNGSDLFVPASSTQANLFVNVGSAVSEKYSRALRFFGQAGLSWNGVSGTGYSLRGGFTTSLFGTDRLTIYGSMTGKSPGDIRGSREFGLAYRLHY